MIDTLKIFSRLKNKGVQEEAANEIAEILNEVVSSELITKPDIEKLKIELEKKIIDTKVELGKKIIDTKVDCWYVNRSSCLNYCINKIIITQISCPFNFEPSALSPMSLSQEIG